jgi:(p)ppGpp synthase/HD superfamily hydrolase
MTSPSPTPGTVAHRAHSRQSDDYRPGVPVAVAQTNIQLYNQLRKRELSLDELVLVHHAYELLTTLYSGYYQGDGKPFVAHGVGVASILAELGQPAEIVAMGLLHAIYDNAHFGDGGAGGTTPFRRQLVRDAVGERVEELVCRFTELRVRPDTIEDVWRTVTELDATERRLQLVAIVDHLEKYVDLGVLYYGDDEEIVDWTRRLGRDLIELADELGEPRLAEMLSKAFEQASAEAERVPEELRASDGRRHLKLVTPRSWRRRD